MTEPRYSLAQETARKLLAHKGPKQPPIDPVELAHQLGVRVVTVNPPDDVSGFFIREDPDSGQPTIGVNKHHSPVRRRFTVAHELGHHLLRHEGDWHIDDMIISFRDSASSSGEHAKEIEANLFAATLLMPQSWVRRDFLRSPFDLGDDQSLQRLSKRYGVSTQSMTYRLVNLKLVT